jgi:hypothetical protein
MRRQPAGRVGRLIATLIATIRRRVRENLKEDTCPPEY